MKKIKFTSFALNEFFLYLSACEQKADTFVYSSIFLEIIRYHIDVMQKRLRVKYVQVLHSGRPKIIVRFDRVECLLLSLMFKHIPVNHVMAPYEYEILKGL